MNERTDEAQFTITRIFDAPRELVWRAWTESADAAEWWHPRGIEIKAGSVAVDARPGGRYAYTMVNPADGAEYPTVGVYREVDPPRRLVYTWRPSWDDYAETTVRFDLVPTATGTRVLVTHSGFGNRAEQAAGTGEGWKRVLEWLGQFVGE